MVMDHITHTVTTHLVEDTGVVDNQQVMLKEIMDIITKGMLLGVLVVMGHERVTEVPQVVKVSW